MPVFRFFAVRRAFFLLSFTLQRPISLVSKEPLLGPQGRNGNRNFSTSVKIFLLESQYDKEKTEQ